MLTVALTGNIASGKSTVAAVWRGLGARVVEADELARRAVGPGTPALASIVALWGERVLTPGGSLDRAALRDAVFRDPAARARLEAIVHPEVRRLRDQELRAAELAGEPLLVADIPLLFEVGMEDEFDVVVLVHAPERTRLERLVRERGMAQEEAQRMIDAQMPSERKRGRADHVIDNDGGLPELRARAAEVWADLERRAGDPG